jgi:replication initiation and membrane attachment protein DnaB
MKKTLIRLIVRCSLKISLINLIVRYRLFRIKSKLKGNKISDDITFCNFQYKKAKFIAEDE